MSGRMITGFVRHHGDGRPCRVRRCADPDATGASAAARTLGAKFGRYLQGGGARSYTMAFVAEAMRRYDAEGREATLAYYNTPESLDGEWYLFVIAADGEVLAHSAIPENVGLIVKKPLGVDANGYDFGAAMLAVTEQGAWVSYVYENPARGNFLETKHAWAIRHDGLIFGSGWYQVDRYDAPPATKNTDRPG